ncbi:MAG: PAS domain-containing protein [Planctomycetes bacterium]|nr:PAS domain-containing protein [Planctomycetota bacterium]
MPRDLGYEQLGARWEAVRDQVRSILDGAAPEAVLRALREAVSSLGRWGRCETWRATGDGSSLSGRVVAGGEPSRPETRPESAWARANRRPVVREAPSGGFEILAPIASGPDLLGWVVVGAPGSIEDVPPALLSDLQFLTDQAAFALTNRRLVEELDARRRGVEEARHFLSNILEGMAHGVMTVSPDGRVTQVNRNMLLMFEVERGLEPGRRLEEILPPAAAGPIRELLEEVLQTGFGMDRLLEHTLSGGTRVDYGVSGSLVRGASGMATGAVLQCRDMTATRELERLRRLDQMKSEFVNNVSHELRTPLTSIKAYTDALLGMVEDETQVKFLRVVEEESDRLLELIENLLNVSRIESGKLHLVLAAVDPSELVRSIEKVSRVQSERHTLILEVAQGMPQVNLDADKMKEVLLNLVSNAVKYSPAGGRVWLRAFPREGNLWFEVADEGLGISEENQKNLFEKFFRVDSEATRNIRGTGLGLAITRSIVQAHGGTLHVASTLGKGSTFTVVLPVHGAQGRQEVDLGTVEQSPFA